MVLIRANSFDEHLYYQLIKVHCWSRWFRIGEFWTDQRFLHRSDQFAAEKRINFCYVRNWSSLAKTRVNLAARESHHQIAWDRSKVIDPWRWQPTSGKQRLPNIKMSCSFFCQVQFPSIATHLYKVIHSVRRFYVSEQQQQQQQEWDLVFVLDLLQRVRWNVVVCYYY